MENDAHSIPLLINANKHTNLWHLRSDTWEAFCQNFVCIMSKIPLYLSASSPKILHSSPLPHTRNSALKRRMEARNFDMLVLGATGFTGKKVAEYIAR